MLVIISVWSLVEPPHLELVHYGKQKIWHKIENMEVEYSVLMTWSPQQAPPSDSTSQWGHNIKVVGLPQKEFRTKRSFIVDMFGFALNGELNNMTNYLRSHGSFELEQVSTKVNYVQYFTTEQPVNICPVVVACYTIYVVD